MSDAERRALERKAAAGDADAVARLHELLRRTGEVRAFDIEVRALLARAGGAVTLAAFLRVLDDALEVAGTRTFSMIDAAFVVRAGQEAVEVWACRRAAGRAEPPFEDQEAVAAVLLAGDPDAAHLRASRTLVAAWRHDANGPWLPIRARPAMWIGSVDGLGVRYLVGAVLEVGLAEHLRGHARRLEVRLHERDEVTIAHDGRGLLTRPPRMWTGDAMPAAVLGSLLTETGAVDPPWFPHEVDAFLEGRPESR